MIGKHVMQEVYVRYGAWIWQVCKRPKLSRLVCDIKDRLLRFVADSVKRLYFQQ